MLFAYIDESSNEHHYRTVALVLPADHVRSLATALDTIIARASAAYAGVNDDFELHGHDLFGATQAWGVLKSSPRARIGIYRDALRVIVDSAEAVFIEGLDRSSFRARYADERDEHVASLLHLMEKLDKYARSADQDIMIIADEHHSARIAQNELRRARHESVWGFRGRPQRITDTVYFVRSDMSRLVQAVDLVAFLHQRVSDVIERNERAAKANAMLWSVLAPLMTTSHDRLWRPHTHNSPRGNEG